MDQNDIRAFLTIAKTGSLNQAANLLFVTQPALSQQLKALETELGTTLFNRKKGQRTLSLTSSGQHFYAIAQKYNTLYAESMQLKHMEDTLSLSVNAVGSLNACLLPPLYLKLASMKPAFSLTLASGKTNSIYQNILTQAFDIGLVHRDFQLRSLDILPVFREKLYFVCAKEFADQLFTADGPDGPGAIQEISPSSLNPAREIYFSWSLEYNSWHSHWFDPSIRPLVYMDQMALIEPLLLGTDRWTVVPSSVITSFKQMDRLYISTLSDPPPPRVCYVITAKDRLQNQSEAISIFMNQFRLLLEQNPWVECL